MAISKKAQAAIDDALSIDAAQDQVGLGIDLVEIDRMRKVLERTPRFKTRVFTEQEAAYCDKKADPASSYAARFAAKEACVKALGTGFTEGIAFTDIEVVMNQKGRPGLSLSGRALEVAKEMGVLDMPLSITHTENDAVACVIAITESSRAATKKRVDPTEELLVQFKQLRGMLDEI